MCSIGKTTCKEQGTEEWTASLLGRAWKRRETADLGSVRTTLGSSSKEADSQCRLYAQLFPGGERNAREGSEFVILYIIEHAARSIIGRFQNISMLVSNVSEFCFCLSPSTYFGSISQ